MERSRERTEPARPDESGEPADAAPVHAASNHAAAAEDGAPMRAAAVAATAGCGSMAARKTTSSTRAGLKIAAAAPTRTVRTSRTGRS